MAHIHGAILSYPNLFIPKLPPNARPGQKARYSCMILLPHAVADSEEVKALQAICFNMLKEKYGENTETLLQAGFANQPIGLKWPFRKDNMKRDGSQRFDPTKFKCFISPWSESAPGLVGRYAGKDGKPEKILTPSQDKFYPGCVVNVSVNPFLYDQAGNRGVAFGLNNVQFWGDGERLDNRVAAEDDFQAEARPVADLSALQADTGSAGVPGAATEGLSTAALSTGKGINLASLLS